MASWGLGGAGGRPSRFKSGTKEDVRVGSSAGSQGPNPGVQWEKAGRERGMEGEEAAEPGL